MAIHITILAPTMITTIINTTITKPLIAPEDKGEERPIDGVRVASEAEEINDIVTDDDDVLVVRIVTDDCIDDEGWVVTT